MRPYWSSFSPIHPWYDTRLYKKQLTNNKNPEVDDEPYIVLPPDNTISTKDEAFKLDDEVDSENAATPKPTNKPTPTTFSTQPPITTPPKTTKLPVITTPITTPITTRPTTLPPPPTTKPTEKAQVIAIQAGTQKRTFPTSAPNINLNLEIGDTEESSQPAQHQNVPMPPTVQSISPSNQPEQSPVQPTPQIIIASMPEGTGASQNQQPQIIMAQPSQTQQPPQVVFLPQPTSQQPQYVIAAPQPAKAQPQYVMAAPPPTLPPPAPVVYQQLVPAPVPVQVYPQPVPAPAAVPPSPVYLSPGTAIATQSSPAGSLLGASQVTVSSSSPASITVNSRASNPSMGDVKDTMMSSSLMGLSSMNPFLASKILSQGGPMYPAGTGGLQVPLLQPPQFPMNSVWPYFTTPLAQQLQLAQSSLMMSSPLMSQGYDPLLYNSLTGMLADAIRSALIQPQPNALVSALALAASQAQARNQPPDILTAALTQALAQNLQQGVQPISNTKLVQALSQALSQVTPAGAPPGTYNPVYPLQQPAPPQQPPPPPRYTQPTAPYTPIKIPPYQLIPNSQQEAPPIRDLRSDSVNKNYSVNKVGKALASALIKAARKIANRNPRFSTRRHNAFHYRHGNRDYGHYRARSYVPLNYPHSPDLSYQTVNRAITNWADDDVRKYFTMFHSFWKRMLPSCCSGWYYRCPLINSGASALLPD